MRLPQCDQLTFSACLGPNPAPFKQVGFLILPLVKSLLWQGPGIARRVQLSPTSHTHHSLYWCTRNSKAAWPSPLGAHTHFWGQCFDKNDWWEEGEQNLTSVSPLCQSGCTGASIVALPAATTIASMDSFYPKYHMKYIQNICFARCNSKYI